MNSAPQKLRENKDVVLDIILSDTADHDKPDDWCDEICEVNGAFPSLSVSKAEIISMSSRHPASSGRLFYGV